MKKCIPLLIMLLLAGCGRGTQEDKANLLEAKSQTGSEEIMNSSQNKPDEAQPKRISFLGVGDNLIHHSIFLSNQKADGSFDFANIYENITGKVTEADIAFINQETVFAGPDYPYTGYPQFNTPDEMGADLVATGFDWVNGTTNHTLDYGTDGALHAVNVWDQYEDVVYSGVHPDEEARNAIQTIEREGVTFALLSYTYDTNGNVPDTDWRIDYFDDDTIREDVARAKAISDVVMVSAHWGDENTTQVNDFQRHYAQLFADLEVDVVIGTHPHIIQPIETVTGVNGNELMVVYSLGNLVSHSLQDYNFLGGMIQFDMVIDGDETAVENVRFEPTVTHLQSTSPDLGMSGFDFKIYMLEDYTAELAAEHAIPKSGGGYVTVENLNALVDETIDATYLD